jgi:hypothetical protein
MLHAENLTHFFSRDTRYHARRFGSHSMSAPSQKLSPLPAPYVALRKKVDAFSDDVMHRRAADLACRSGCAGCCHVELSVNAVEAAAIRDYLSQLSAADRAALRQALSAIAPPSPGAPPRCAMLRDDDTCAIYPARPLVCRSQGLPLLYPAEIVPEAARRGRSADGRALTICPLNFTNPDAGPERQDILDAERVDVLLSLITRQFAAAAGTSSTVRYGLADLVKEFVE